MVFSASIRLLFTAWNVIIPKKLCFLPGSDFLWHEKSELSCRVSCDYHEPSFGMEEQVYIKGIEKTLQLCCQNSTGENSGW